MKHLLVRISKGLESLLSPLRIRKEQGNPETPMKDSKVFRSLMIAAYGGDINNIKKLIHGQSMNVNIQDENGWSALHWAVFSSRINTVKWLVEEEKADFRLRDYDGRTPLHIAKLWQINNVVKYLQNRERKRKRKEKAKEKKKRNHRPHKKEELNREPRAPLASLQSL